MKARGRSVSACIWRKIARITSRSHRGSTSFHATHGCAARVGLAPALGSLQEAAVARVRMIKPEEADADTRRVYDGVRKQWGRISNFSQVLAHQPSALAGWMLPNETTIRLANVKSDPDYVKIQQLVIIKTSALNHSAYCMSHNVPLGRKIGLTEAQIKAAQGSDYMRSPDLDDWQKSAIRWAEAVTLLTARDDEAAFAALKQHFSEKQLVELTVFCGMWNY